MQLATTSDCMDKSIPSDNRKKPGRKPYVLHKERNSYCTVLKRLANCDMDLLSVKEEKILTRHKVPVSLYENKYPGGVHSRAAVLAMWSQLLLHLKPHSRD